MVSESASIRAIKLVRAVFESVHGNLGLLKFNIEELIPTNGTNGEESKKWDITCSFFETLGSNAPTRYKVSVSLNDNSVSIKKISEEASQPARSFVVKETPQDSQI
ncbi:MAG: hypothetical protein ACD_51C00200G0004 [uncultured bacterium]|nr:MAG: hypothetical protein ACD_51C00200G0004 [uncultured bacterium]OGJ47431.1 MAG: hypothetical protein A2244_01715 [Candidatus Peregrinibacteria bacterium RIFOXYA2_FULL_41_18]OGJ49459.1 MAG: hypothetical protein A2344_00305 [Candidatus Peregrinibacteria bacterium RIFOXYB12_FULL_41_12]OGJ53360.1 MAG: hypothetical protein A2448_01320 [Candidatus Peregrinibacteria bacterium RIFOXYC2_FULL_41_22]OGJ54359.1 MAG: hypothetical protein A2336_00190 [Candidatus Peregrinibacteria bacterium RIFOXYB2_FULL